MNPYFDCGNRYVNAMEGCVERVNAMFLEAYILFALQEKAMTDGGQENQGESSKDYVQQMGAEYAKPVYEGDKLSAGGKFVVLSRELIDDYIEKIVVYNEQHIEVVWNESVRTLS